MSKAEQLDWVRSLEATVGVVAGPDVFINFIGAPYLDRNIRSMALGERLVQVGILGGGSKAKLLLDLVLFRHLRILGTVMKSRPQEV